MTSFGIAQLLPSKYGKKPIVFYPTPLDNSLCYTFTHRTTNKAKTISTYTCTACYKLYKADTKNSPSPADIYVSEENHQLLSDPMQPIKPHFCALLLTADVCMEAEIRKQCTEQRIAPERPAKAKRKILDTIHNEYDSFCPEDKKVMLAALEGPTPDSLRRRLQSNAKKGRDEAADIKQVLGMGDEIMQIDIQHGSGSTQVPLVEPRGVEERGIVSVKQTDKATPDDIVALAQQLQNARELVKGRACDRLQSIAKQMEQLHMAARLVLEDAARDEALHRVPCNMSKQPGRVYHLYEKSDGYRFFSMLSPIEWNKADKDEQFVASYRLEFDRSWTPMTDVESRDAQYARFENLLNRGTNSLGLEWGK